MLKQRMAQVVSCGGRRLRQAEPRYMLGHGGGLEAFTSDQERRARAHELHRAGQVTAEWCEPQLELIVQLVDELAFCAWDGRGSAKDAVLAAYPDALGFQFPDAEGDYVICGNWLAVA